MSYKQFKNQNFDIPNDLVCVYSTDAEVHHDFLENFVKLNKLRKGQIYSSDAETLKRCETALSNVYVSQELKKDAITYMLKRQSKLKTPGYIAIFVDSALISKTEQNNLVHKLTETARDYNTVVVLLMKYNTAPRLYFENACNIFGYTKSKNALRSLYKSLGSKLTPNEQDFFDTFDYLTGEGNLMVIVDLDLEVTDVYEHVYWMHYKGSLPESSSSNEPVEDDQQKAASNDESSDDEEEYEERPECIVC